MKKRNKIVITGKPKFAENKEHRRPVVPAQNSPAPEENIPPPPSAPDNSSKTPSGFSGNKKIALAGSLLLLLVGAAIFYFSSNNDPAAQAENTTKTTETVEKPAYSYTIPPDYPTAVTVMTENVPFRNYLIAVGIPRQDAENIGKQADKRKLSTLSIGDRIISAFASEAEDIPEMLIVEPKSDPTKYYFVQMTDPLKVIQKSRATEIKTKTAVGIIDSSLWLTILDNNIHYQLIDHLESALAWSVDFYHLSPGDYFKVLYREKFIDGKSYGIEGLDAVYFNYAKEEVYAFKYNEGGKVAFYDEHGQEVKKAFLKSPLKYGRMSSPYSLDRKHPVTGENKPHFGTDYAAPTGTPILAVADGIVTKREFKANNGNYVKIRHDKKYESQYLHMSEFVPAVVTGSRVRQGEVIGYVGATGLATGPHVCFRFWRNGQQVDHRAEKGASQQQLSYNSLKDYSLYRDSMMNVLKNISWR